MSRAHALRLALWLAGVALALFAVVRVSQALQSSVLAKLMETHASLVDWVVWAALALYTALIALPFVPGAEVGMALLSTFGAKIAVAVYLATVVGLLIGYTVGWLVPVHRTAGLMRLLCLARAADWLDGIAELPRDEIAARFTQALPPAARKLVGWRYLALVLLINLPGNSLLGGGGGIALAAGLSRLFSPPGFLLAVLVAVLPVPLMVLLMAGH